MTCDETTATFRYSQNQPLRWEVSMHQCGGAPPRGWCTLTSHLRGRWEAVTEVVTDQSQMVVTSV